MLHLLVMYGAVDIGGTKTLVAVFDESGKIVEQQKFPTPQDYEQFIKELVFVVGKLNTSDFRRCVVAVPGLLDRKQGIAKALGNLPWTDVPIEKDAEKIFGCPVLIENDTKLAALSEATLVKGFKKVLYVTISTGISGGLIINGKIDPAFQDIEPGHMLLEYEDKLEKWEDFASGRAIVAKFGKRASELTDSTAWYVIARNIAVGLNVLIASLNPEVIIIGGGVGAHFEKFQDRLGEELKLYETPLTPVPPIQKAQRAEEAVIYGCYELARSHHANAAKAS